MPVLTLPGASEFTGTPWTSSPALECDAMDRLWYLFWAVPIFVLGCCAPPQRLAYLPTAYTEVAQQPPAPSLYDHGALARTQAMGGSEIHGINLNSRVEFKSSAGYYEGPDIVGYRVYQYDRYGSNVNGGGTSSDAARVQDYFRRNVYIRQEAVRFR